MIGFKIGSYEIIEPLSRGTSTTTWLARDARGRRAVAKRLLDALAADEAVVERFLAAVGQSSKIRMRKHVATVVAQKRCSDGVFLLRQYVEGESLSRYAEQGRLSALDRDQVARDLCDAVRDLTSRDVVHGGLHPGNVIIQADGRVKVTDFGIAATVLTGGATSCPLETLAYLAPEQWRGAEATPQTDIYSVAAIIWLVDRGAPVFRNGDRRQLEREILAGRSGACPVLAAALDPAPARRYDDIRELRTRLADRNDGDNPSAEREKPAPLRADGGTLAWIFDVKEQRNLLESLPPKPWIVARDGRRQQRPLQLANRGTGDLDLFVSCTGDGLSASPAHVVVSPGQMGAVIVRLEPDSARFANLIFRWSESGNDREVVVKVVRRG